MAFLGSIDYLVPAAGMSWHLGHTLDVLLSATSGVSSRLRIHFDTSEDLTEEVIAWQNAYPDKVSFSTWADGGPRGPAAVRNSLANHSNADYLCFLDSDVVLPTFFDYHLRDFLTSDNLDKIFYPRILGRHDEAGPSHFFQEKVLAPIHYASGHIMITSAVFGLSKRVWWRLGGFDERFRYAGGEDWAFFRDIQGEPFFLEVAFTENLVAFHENPRDYETLWSRARRYALQAHLHTAPPPASDLKWSSFQTWRKEVGPRLAGLLRFLAAKSYGLLLVANKLVAQVGRGGAFSREFSQLLIFLRNASIYSARICMGRIGGRTKEWDHLLFMERVRHSRIVTRLMPLSATQGTAQEVTQVPDRAGQTPIPSALRGPTRRIYSSRNTLLRRIQNLCIHLKWRKIYLDTWRVNTP